MCPVYTASLESSKGMGEVEESFGEEGGREDGGRYGGKGCRGESVENGEGGVGDSLVKV